MNSLLEYQPVTDAYVENGIANAEAFLAEAAVIGAVATANVAQTASSKYSMDSKFKNNLPSDLPVNSNDVVPAMDLEAIAGQKMKDLNSKIALIKHDNDIQAAADQARRIDYITFLTVNKKTDDESED